MLSMFTAYKMEFDMGILSRETLAQWVKQGNMMIDAKMYEEIVGEKYVEDETMFNQPENQ